MACKVGAVQIVHRPNGQEIMHIGVRLRDKGGSGDVSPIDWWHTCGCCRSRFVPTGVDSRARIKMGNGFGGVTQIVHARQAVDHQRGRCSVGSGRDGVVAEGGEIRRIRSDHFRHEIGGIVAAGCVGINAKVSGIESSILDVAGAEGTRGAADQVGCSGMEIDRVVVDIERSILLHLVDRAKESGVSLF